MAEKEELSLRPTRASCRLIDLKPMQQIRAYNVVDCKAMLEVVRYLRERY